MANTYRYSYIENGRRVDCEHTDCEPEFQKFSINAIDKGKHFWNRQETTVDEYRDEEYENDERRIKLVNLFTYGIYMWRFFIAFLIIVFVFVLTTLIVVIK